MDLNQRSPSFLEVKYTKASTQKKNSPKLPKMMLKPVPTIQLLQSLNMYSPIEQASTVKKLNMKPLRTNEINLNEFKKSPEVTTRNVRKQLWSLEKGDKLRRGTLMKAGGLRKTAYSRASLIQSKKNTSKKQSKCLSADDTLPLMDMEQLTLTNIKRTLFPVQQTKQPLNQRKTISQINVNKIPMVSSLSRKMVKQIPSIVITPTEKSAKKSIGKTTSNIKPKIEKDKKDETIELVFKRLTLIEEKIKSFDDIKALLHSICLHLGIEVPANSSAKETQKSGQKSPKTKEKTKSNLKKEVCSTPLHTITENISTEFEEKLCKLSPLKTKEIKQTSSETIEKIHNTTPCISKTAANNHAQKNTIQESDLRKKNIPELNTENLNNNNDNNEEEEKNNVIENSPEIERIQTQFTSNNIVENTQLVKNIINNTDSTVKVKKTWITQFQQLENKLLNNSNASLNLNSSSDDSPVIPPLQIDEIINNNEEINQLTLKKSQSIPNLSETNASQRKNTFFKSKESELLTESICVYKELRNELPVILSTPVNKVNKTMSFMTPSTKGNEKKLISRRVQEQLLRLNDF